MRARHSHNSARNLATRGFQRPPHTPRARLRAPQPQVGTFARETSRLEALEGLDLISIDAASFGSADPRKIVNVERSAAGSEVHGCQASA